MSVFEKVKLKKIKNHVRTRNKLFNLEKIQKDCKQLSQLDD